MACQFVQAIYRVPLLLELGEGRVVGNNSLLSDAHGRQHVQERAKRELAGGVLLQKVEHRHALSGDLLVGVAGELLEGLLFGLILGCLGECEDVLQFLLVNL